MEKNAGTTWAHPKWFFEESLNYQRLLLARLSTPALRTPGPSTASNGEKAVAYLLYEVIWGNTAFLSLLKVLAEYQRKGIGTAMIKLLEERLLSQGFKSYVTSSEMVNQNTKHFFPALEFAPIGELQMQHGSEIFYLKKLSID